MDVELLFMEMKDHWSNQSTDPEISSSPLPPPRRSLISSKNSAKML